MSADERRVLHCGDATQPGHPLLRPCPQRWGDLADTGEERIRHCSMCDHLVYRVANVVEARVRARQGECLAVPEAVYDQVHAVAHARLAHGITIGFFDEGAFIDDHLTDPSPDPRLPTAVAHPTEGRSPGRRQ